MSTFPVRQIGVVTKKDNSAVHIKWEDGQREIVLSDALSVIKEGQRFEAIIERGAFDWSFNGASEVKKMGCLPTKRECQKLWDELTKTNIMLELPDADWD